jgi:hypothetical protein
MSNDEISTTTPVPPPVPPESENEAIIDAGKTFRITVLGAVLFGLAAAFIILRTRLG